METLAPMNARSLLMVMRSRTLGILCTVTWSAVSRAAAITGSAEFFAPLTQTVPSCAEMRRMRYLFVQCLMQIPFCCCQFFLRILGVHSMLQHYQCDSHVVSRLTQGVFGCRQAPAASFSQDAHDAI